MFHKISPLLTILFLLTLPSCNYWKSSRLQSKGSILANDFFHGVEFEIRKGLVVVQAKINNSEKSYEFIFDTGAYSSIISRELAEQLDLLPKASRKTGDSRGNIREMEVVLLKNIDLNGLQIRNIAAGIIDFPENSPIQCIAKDGIIGANLIRECHWKMDFQERKMWMTDNFDQFTEIKDQTPLPFKHSKKNGKPYINLKLEDYLIQNVLVDVGSNGGLDLRSKWLKKHPEFLIERPLVMNFDSTSTGLWGRAMDTTKVAYVKSLQLGPHQLSEWRVDFNQRGNPKIGMEILSHFNVYLNYESSELYLIPVKPLDKYDLNSYGFVPDYVSPHFFIVRNIFVPSSASQAGLMLGDTITHINNQPPARHFDDYCDYFRWAGNLLRKTDSLIVTKNGQNTLLKKEPLLQKPH